MGKKVCPRRLLRNVHGPRVPTRPRVSMLVRAFAYPTGQKQPPDKRDRARAMRRMTQAHRMTRAHRLCAAGTSKYRSSRRHPAAPSDQCRRAWRWLARIVVLENLQPPDDAQTTPADSKDVKPSRAYSSSAAGRSKPIAARATYSARRCLSAELGEALQPGHGLRANHSRGRYNNSPGPLSGARRPPRAGGPFPPPMAVTCSSAVAASRSSTLQFHQ
jgi:hypothetical protein